MNNFLLEITSNDYGSSIIETKGFMETLGFGAMMLLIGMLTVFAVLTLIWGALVIFKLCFHDLPAKKKAKPVAEVKNEESVVAAPVVTDDTEIIAVLAAAVAMAESENNGTKFRVVSFKRK